MKNIKYIGFYDTNSNSKENRNFFLSGRNKMNYVIQTLNHIDYSVQVISPSWTKNNKFYGTKKEYIFNDNELILCPTIPRGNKFIKLFSSFFSSVWLFIYLVKHTKKNEQIMVYHSLNLMWPIKYAKMIKKFSVILELEEIYSEVWNEKKGYMSSELKYIDEAEGLIVVSDKLRNRFENKKPIILYGAYKNEKRTSNKIKQNNYVNLVYAGVIEDQGKAALNSVQSMKYLPNQYKLFILGYGNERNITKLNKEIEKINSEKNIECCFFEGTKTGKAYSNFLFECDIALNPQKIGSYMNSAFPSKILAYLSHDLFIVSTKIEAIVHSRIAPSIVFSENEHPSEIANAILNINLDEKSNISEFIDLLGKEFKENLRKILI